MSNKLHNIFVRNVPAKVYRHIRFVCTKRGITSSEYLSGLVLREIKQADKAKERRKVKHGAPRHTNNK